MYHNHCNCNHILNYCGICDVVYCSVCNKEWTSYSNSFTYTMCSDNTAGGLVPNTHSH